MNFLSRLKELFLNFLFPKSDRILELESLSPSQLVRTLSPSSEIKERHIVALFDYGHSVVKEIVWEIKYGGNKRLARTMGQILYDYIIGELEERNVFAKWPRIVLMPMPVSDKRRFERGWNQAELLASAIKECDTSNVFKYLPRQLAKLQHTESQTRTATKSERLHNLTNTMRVLNPDSVKDKFVVLIDDVTTTGATFSEARRALETAGVKKILCVALAH